MNVVDNRRGDGTYESTVIASLNEQIVAKRKNIHIVVTVNRESGISKIYLHGKFYTEKPFSQTTNTINSSDFLIGNIVNPNANPYTAHHCRLFNYELSKTDVNYLYNSGSSDTYRLNYGRNTLSEKKCIIEFISEGLVGNQWINTIDKNLSMSFVGTNDFEYNGKVSSLTPLFVARGAVFNEQTGYYELNGLTDITEEQMMTIYNESNNTQSSANSCFALFYNNKMVTNFIPATKYLTPPDAGLYGAVSCRAMFRACINIKVVNLGERLKANDITYIFLSYNVLEKILGIIDISENLASLSYIFRSCSLLESVNIFGLNKSVSLIDSPLLNRDSILYLINNATNTNASPNGSCKINTRRHSFSK